MAKRQGGLGVTRDLGESWERLPLPKGHPLWKFQNAIVTPHIAGRSDKDRARMIGTITENIQRFTDGRPLLNVVDKKKGY